MKNYTNVLKLKREAERYLDQALQTVRLSNGLQLAALYFLCEHKRLSVSDLARRCRVPATSFTTTVDALEARGFAVRQDAIDDRRVVYLEPTESGKAALARVMDEIAIADRKIEMLVEVLFGTGVMVIQE